MDSVTLAQAAASGKHHVIDHYIFGGKAQAHVATDHGVLKFKVSDGDTWMAYADVHELIDTIDGAILFADGGWRLADEGR